MDLNVVFVHLVLLCQCIICTENKIKPTEENIDKFLSGNLCRCTGYLPIKNAIKNMYSYKSNKFSKVKLLDY